MKKKSSIVILSIIGFVLCIGMILSFLSFEAGLKSFHSFAENVDLGLDLKGGVYAVYEAEYDDIGDFNSRIKGTAQSLQTMLVNQGYTGATAAQQGKNKIRVEVPYASDAQTILENIGKRSSLKFFLTENSDASGGNEVMSGADVKSAEAFNNNGDPAVILVFNEEGKDKFSDITSSNRDKFIRIASVAEDGTEEILTAIKIGDPITDGQAVISGSRTMEEAQIFASRVIIGSYRLPLEQKEFSAIDSALESGQLKWCLIAGGIAFLLVLALMCFMYRGLGIISAANLLIWFVLMLFMLSVFPWAQLSLAGIAAAVFSFAIAVGGNIFVFEKIKEEYKNGKSMLASLYYGFRRAQWGLIDSAVIIAVMALVMLFFPIEAIKNFAIILLIGLVFATLGSILIVRLLTRCFLAINDKNERFYNLERGKDYIGVESDKTDARVQERIDADMEEKARKAQARQEQRRLRDEGGLDHE